MNITVLQTTKAGRVLTKRISGLDGDKLISPYDNETFFRYELIPFDTIDDLAGILEVLRKCPDACVIHGQPNHSRNSTRRTFKSTTSDNEIKDVETGWVMFDFDKTPVENCQEDIEQHSEMLIKSLPDEFHNISYYSCYSSSAGVKPSNWSAVSVHIWFVLDKPILATELFEWGRLFVQHNISRFHTGIIDKSVLNVVQPNYTADPIFTNIADPVKKRTILVKKEDDRLVLPYFEPIAKPQPYEYQPSTTIGGAFNERLEHKLNTIGVENHYHTYYGVLKWYILSCHNQGLDPDRNMIIQRIQGKLSEKKPQYVQGVPDAFDRAYAQACLDFPKMSFEDARLKRFKSKMGYTTSRTNELLGITKL